MIDSWDDFVSQASLSFPNLKYFIAQTIDLGDIEALLELLMSLDTGMKQV